MQRLSRRAPGEVTPGAYRQWRDSDLGSITEAKELEVVLEVVGDVAGLRVLDLGCGDGIHVVEAARRGAVATGIDASTGMLEAARERVAAERVEVHLLRVDAQDLPFDEGSFNIVTAVTILCLVNDAHAVLAEAARVLTPGGRVIIGELGRWNTWAAWRRIRGSFGSPTWKHARFSSGAGTGRPGRGIRSPG